MKNIFIGAVLLSAQLFLVSTAPIVPEQENCVEGEPMEGQRQPDVNITILPSTEIPELSPVEIVCDADLARFPANLTPPATAPVKITIRIGIYNVKECKNNVGVFQCNYSVSSFIPGIPQRISCTASTEDRQCRFKTASITIAQEPTTPSGNVTSTTSPPTTSAPATPPTPTGDSASTPVTTPVIPPTPPTTTATPTPTEDGDSDDDSDDDSDSDDSDSDSDSDSD
ncbi:mucin-2-like [Dendronephthya gigantea]|uniref:mucin-2-like n=1 Tax=Dendronephthya gigantea TaxID=151771 RepID=UPI00106A3819|nr:mucin-2-like [Dendronephthya gigantea]